MSCAPPEAEAEAEADEEGAEDAFASDGPEPPEEHAASSSAPEAMTATDAPARRAVVGIRVMAVVSSEGGSDEPPHACARGKAYQRRAAAHD
ncbi:hypothetical protein HCN08_06945 [Streptomyces sp. PRB2-1]|uniref:Uncharacterized protein n=1 Tax=Actinacidiphila epipremni TaxID=2053013 RepID=A0ABX0ZH48_9ACTN|nr:hypothetical protein [Actinacidiphila epipremni]